MYGFWYNYVKPKYGEKTKLCYMDTGSFIVYIKTEHFYSDIAKYVKARSSHPEVFLGKGILKICSKFTGERPC